MGPRQLKANFLSQVWRHTFVCIDDQHPLVIGLWDRPILKVATCFVLALYDANFRIALGDRQRVIGGERFGDNDFVSQRQNTFDAGTDVQPLILAGDDDG